MNSFLCHLKDALIIPVLKITDASFTVPLLDALFDAGLNCPEITFRTNCAAECIKLAKKYFSDAIIGAGTINSTEDAKKAIDAGADFLVSPGSTVPLLDWCAKNKVPFVPGVATATEIQTALSYGFTLQKFFPSECLGGTKTLKALSAPFAGVSFLPTGGITPDNAQSYLQLSFVKAVAGTWIAHESLVNEQNWKAISDIAKKTYQLIQLIKQEQEK